MTQGDVWWADLGGSEPGFRCPVVVVQCDGFNRSRIATVVCVPLTSSLRWADAPGNVLLEAAATGLPKDSVANVSRVVALDRDALTDRVGRLPERTLGSILGGIEVVLGRWRGGRWPVGRRRRVARAGVSVAAAGAWAHGRMCSCRRREPIADRL